ncbi:uncharacterized protein LOC114129489 [Aphis gossypii]|uniref:Uncharacterized protein n=1 Tax=Aphis gossypii TaxID=80765 RepID=A0A9P0J892_APHGO|nr:uncharacterized protein LOC114129489 [Aphis gossypii]CAH1731005.1 unnamed protein product [Aphis gossypii]
MDGQRRKFVIETEKSRSSPRVSKKILDRSSYLEKYGTNLFIKMEKASDIPCPDEKIYQEELYDSSDSFSFTDSEDEYKIAKEEEEPSYLQKIIGHITDYFEKDEVEEIKPRYNTFAIRDINEWRSLPKENSEFKIRSVRDLIDRWYFKSLAKDLANIQPELLKMDTKIRCLNYIRYALLSDYEKSIIADEDEAFKTLVKLNI